MRLQKRLFRARRPVDTAADVVEKVILTGGELYLHTREGQLAWWQLALLDVYAALAAAGLGLLAALVLLCWLLTRGVKRLRTGSRPGKTKAA